MAPEASPSSPRRSPSSGCSRRRPRLSSSSSRLPSRLPCVSSTKGEELLEPRPSGRCPSAPSPRSSPGLPLLPSARSPPPTPCRCHLLPLQRAEPLPPQPGAPPPLLRPSPAPHGRIRRRVLVGGRPCSSRPDSPASSASHRRPPLQQGATSTALARSGRIPPPGPRPRPPVPSPETICAARQV